MSSAYPFYLNPKIYGFAVLGLFGLSAVLGSFTIVDGGKVGVIRRLGAIQEVALEEGIHFKVPYIDHVSTQDVRTKPLEVKIGAAS